MKSKLILACAMVAISLSALCACSSVLEQVSVDASYMDKEVELVAGDTLTITLESNPTTGFQWELTEITDQNVLEQQGEPEFKAPEDETLVGASGEEIWTFKALEKGKSTISMEYQRSWEDIEPAETFVLTIVVR